MSDWKLSECKKRSTDLIRSTGVRTWAERDRAHLISLVEMMRAALQTCAQGCGCVDGKACTCVTDFASRRLRELDKEAGR